MTNTQKLIQAQRELINILDSFVWDNDSRVCKLKKKIAKLETKIISEETIKK